MPVSDWEFWVVSVIALGGLFMLLRPIIRRKGVRGSCSPPPARPRGAKLTIEGTPVRDKS